MADYLDNLINSIKQDLDEEFGKMIHNILYWMMLIGFAGLSIQGPGARMKIIGILLTFTNALLFWK